MKYDLCWMTEKYNWQRLIPYYSIFPIYALLFSYKGKIINWMWKGGISLSDYRELLFELFDVHKHKCASDIKCWEYISYLPLLVESEQESLPPWESLLSWHHQDRKWITNSELHIPCNRTKGDTRSGASLVSVTFVYRRVPPFLPFSTSGAGTTCWFSLSLRPHAFSGIINC